VRVNIVNNEKAAFGCLQLAVSLLVLLIEEYLGALYSLGELGDYVFDSQLITCKRQKPI
jgi:hypothetical protein